MEINITVQDHFSLINFLGKEINLAGTSKIRNQLTKLVYQGHINIVFNLSNITFIDSNAISILISLYKICVAQGGDLKLCSPNSDVEMILYLTGIDRFIDIYFSEEEALATKKPHQWKQNA